VDINVAEMVDRPSGTALGWPRIGLLAGPAGEGRPGRGSSNEENNMAETWSGEFYCVKCKAKREATGEIHVSDKGTKMAKGICPVCSTKLNRILGKA
jgi:hypothetical protein